METLANLYVYNGKNISFIIMLKILHAVIILAKKEDSGFDEVYADFLESNTYQAIQEPRSLMWYENAEFIADEYYREKSCIQGQPHV
ncbi:MAG: hypothetical protein LBR97_06965 [Dysgonamonadaceae bacterium]|jgi:hypothetical protein|nr:hypothetical protein [Dysgonamonadaceae bacterium]